MMRHHRRAAALVLATLLVLSGCGSASRTASDDESRCRPADKEVVSEIMSKARTNFKDGDSVTERFELVKAVTGPIPESRQKYGASRLMALLVAVYVKDPDVPDSLQAAQGAVYVVLDDDGRPLGPLGTFSQPFFDIEPPADPGWTSWADAIDDSDVALDLFGCVNPANR